MAVTYYAKPPDQILTLLEEDREGVEVLRVYTCCQYVGGHHHALIIET
ncbi:hypothetical protein COLO4_14413 [Corchorus olitorius]|uniref:Uncharacterized protein n=1 Tax=Corchorus olitorius TaxID=93759 RepID=A0A1R3JS95_9ROSI|nr:hypothetical protein COLO4_14413 [Corchorus olitorius]